MSLPMPGYGGNWAPTAAAMGVWPQPTLTRTVGLTFLPVYTARPASSSAPLLGGISPWPRPLTWPTTHGARAFPVMIEQSTSLGPFWVRTVSPPVLVVPAGDHLVFADSLLAP